MSCWAAPPLLPYGTYRPKSSGVPTDHPADRTAWPMGDGTRVGGQAALLTVQGRRASVQFVRLPGAEKM